MKEHEQILERWTEVEKIGEEAVLATVVKTQGSSYRLSGARLLLTRSGQRAGSISGGCLEDDLVKKAWWLTEAGPVIRRYDTTPEGEITREYGLGCSGIIHVLLERVIPGRARLLDLLKEVRTSRTPVAVLHVLQPVSEIGKRLILDAQGRAESNVADPALEYWMLRTARELLRGSQPRIHFLRDKNEIFAETLAPPVRLLIFGAGEDAVPLTQFARHLGWQVHVYDGRAHYARAEKFPAAHQVSVLKGNEPAEIPIDRWTAAVIMSHSYSQDLQRLRDLSGHPLPYLGILGPQKRTRQLLEDAGLDDTQLRPVLRSPMGLDIGADGPEQVALAVIAEIQAVMNGRGGGALYERQGSIHAEGIEAEDKRFFVRPVVCT
ncbi:MAG: XdhC family protein [Acidobacteriaceae bacterium]|nr:XdhC family protein [Acidobacteriaceae bacterium]